MSAEGAEEGSQGQARSATPLDRIATDHLALKGRQMLITDELFWTSRLSRISIALSGL